MRFQEVSAAAALALFAAAAWAEPIALRPADPQPEAGALLPGLSVRYAYPHSVRSLREAREWLESGSEQGEPLPNLRHRDSMEGDPTLTAKQPMRVAAAISGYVRFERPGPQQVEFLSNDGLEVSIGGAVVSKHDGVHPCETNGVVDVLVPEPGWYEIELTYFQWKGTSCLLMRWGAEGEKLGWAPDEAFARRAD
ncbi:MAG: hypothetical protein ACE37J_07345 [Pikeienuella sp.]|uniref:hypothetical protein n=1 Tax=Pikeienuella sp. TaxID=2831957 RepID=UPI00391CADB1